MVQRIERIAADKTTGNHSGVQDLTFREEEKMALLIDDLLVFAEICRKPVNRVMIDMDKLADNVLTDLAVSPPHNVTITHDELIPVLADPLLIETVMVNLVSNAIKYSSKQRKPVVHISSEKSADEVIYAIKDNGIGFDMELAGTLFGVFQKLHSEQEFPGSGIGLAAVQNIIQKHDGRVWAASKPNEGSTFYFSLREA